MNKIAIIACILFSCSHQNNNYSVSENMDYPDLSKYSISQFNTYNQNGLVFPNYVLADDTIEENSKLFAKVWLTDSMFQRIANVESLKYEKTLYLDTLGKFNWDRSIKLQKEGYDTISISFKTQNIQNKNQIEERIWSTLFNSRFTDKGGNTYDTNFV
ncbi:MAG: hypothetical protein ACOCWM_05130, partial [Cyclobacteriaceae bacterium]